MRSSKPRVWTNPWTPGQIGASPIQHWTALHVWLLIFSEREEYNPWYEMGLDRIGCVLCPASDLAELRMVSSSPRFVQWQEMLTDYAEHRGLPKEWVEYGAWRWKRVPDSFIQELKRLQIDIAPRETVGKDKERSELRLYLSAGTCPCTLGFSIEGAFDRSIDIVRTANILNMIGETDLNEKEGWCTVGQVTIFDSGALIAKGKNEKEIKENIERVRRAVVKAEECVCCGICVARCSEGALRLTTDRIQIEIERCVHCGHCFEPCPAITFGDNAFDSAETGHPLRGSVPDVTCPRVPPSFNARSRYRHLRTVQALASVAAVALPAVAVEPRNRASASGSRDCRAWRWQVLPCRTYIWKRHR